jgi:uncharacterized protein (TIGR00725 family)
MGLEDNLHDLESPINYIDQPGGPHMLEFSESAQALIREGEGFDPWALAWRPRGDRPDDVREVALLEGLAWLNAQPKVRRVPVAVIGPKAAASRHLAVAEQVGRRLGELGVPMVCGGRGGVMEAACRGNLEAGGLPIGILPGEEWDEANPYVAIPLATGLGPARNAVIARAAIALIAIGGEYGTLSEMAFGMHFDRLVVALEDAPEMPGVLRCHGVETALEHVARRILALDR